MKKPSMISILLFLTGLLCIIALIFFNRTTLHQILTTEKEVDTISEQITAKHDEVKQAVDKYTTAIDTVQSNINRMKQKQQTATQKKTKEKAEIPEESSSKPSVFSQNSTTPLLIPVPAFLLRSRNRRTYNRNRSRASE